MHSNTFHRIFLFNESLKLHRRTTVRGFTLRRTGRFRKVLSPSLSFDFLLCTWDMTFPCWMSISFRILMESFNAFYLPSSQQIPKLQIPIAALGQWEKAALNGNKNPHVYLKNSSYNGLNKILLGTVQLLLLYRQQKKSYCISYNHSWVCQAKVTHDSCIYKLIYS